MKYIVIDIGSNTIKMDLYSISAPGCVHLDKQDSITAGLISYIENNQMNKEGIDRLCSTLKQFQEQTATMEHTHMLCFATASLRRASNAQKIIKEVFDQTRIKIQLLSEEQEALFSMKAVQHEIGINKSGIMLDMGGGSTEKVLFDNDTILSARSMPFGCLSLYREFVSDALPTLDEAQRIAAYVLDQFQDSLASKQESLYIVGGTGRAICSLHAHLYGQTDNKLYTIQTADLIALKNKLLLSSNIESQLEAIIPERKYTFMPGFIALCTMAEQAETSQTVFPLGNVRQGYLLSIL